MNRRTVAIIAGSVIAIGAVVWWIAASGSESSAAGQRTTAGHAERMEEAAEAAENAMSGARTP